METYNKYTQIIPTSTEVVNYFISQGLSAEEGLYWFNWQDRKEWKDASGKKIMEWSKIAWLRIQDLKSKKAELSNISIGKSLHPAPKKKTAELIIAESLASLFRKQTGKDSSVVIKLLTDDIMKFKVKYSITDDIELAKSISYALEECSDWEYESIISFL